jgi:hypothetical protein
MPLLNPADPYSAVDTSRTAEMETAGRDAPVRVVQERPLDDQPASSNQQPAPAQAFVGPAAFKMPFSFEGFTVGTPIGAVPSPQLARALEWAMKSNATGAHMEFIQAAEMVLDDRKGWVEGA